VHAATCSDSRDVGKQWSTRCERRVNLLPGCPCSAGQLLQGHGPPRQAPGVFSEALAAQPSASSRADMVLLLCRV